MKSAFHLYRHFDDKNRLLYIGRTDRGAFQRLMEHVKLSQWAASISKVTIEHCASADELRRREELAIVKEQPAMNTVWNTNNPNRGELAMPESKQEAPWLNSPRKTKCESGLFRVEEIADYYQCSVEEVVAWAHASDVGLARWEGTRMWGRDIRKFARFISQKALQAK